MSKHTPGPWRFEAFTGPDGETGPVERACVWADSEAWAVATCEHWGGDRHDAEANARLIAAAPELLEALRPFVEAYVAKRNPGTCDLDDEQPQAWHVPLGAWRAAARAIAKAKGDA